MSKPNKDKDTNEAKQNDKKKAKILTSNLFPTCKQQAEKNNQDKKDHDRDPDAPAAGGLAL